VDEYFRSRMDDDPAKRTWAESMEFARGLREGSAKEHPYAYGGGFVGGIAANIKAGAKVLAKAPAAVRSVFTLQKGQTARNIARLSASSAAVAGTTAGIQEGVEAVPTATAVGAVLGPVAAGATRGAVAGGRYVASKISPDNAAIRILSKRLGESADAIATRYNEFVQTMGRKPRLVEIMRRESAEEMGQISTSKVGVEAGRVFREAEEAASASRPGELRAQIERGGRTTTVPEQQADLAPITEETRRVVGGRVRSTETAQIARRDASMDRAMSRIGDHYVHMTQDMKDIIEHPDIQGVLPAPLRRRINDAIEQGMDLGSIDIPVRTWEMMRYEMAKRAGGPGASQIFSQYRDRIRDYVSNRVPEYDAALKEFGRRTVGAEATTAAERAVGGSSREFADMIRVAGSEPHNVTARATSRVGVRNWLANQLESPVSAKRVMDRLARDNKLRANLRTVMSRDEMMQLDALGEQYGHKLNIIEGVKVGSKIVTSDSDRFADAVRTAADVPGGMVGARTGARGALAAKAGESPAVANTTARAMAQNPGLQSRLVTAFGGDEAARLQRVGELTTKAGRNLAAATPRQTEAQLRAQALAQETQEIIGAAVMTLGRSSGAFRANIANNAVQRMRMSKGVAKRLAEMAVDPDRAHIFISRVRAAGVRDEELLQWYRDAAIAAGVTAGSSVQ
jgi:hypothetical protein